MKAVMCPVCLGKGKYEGNNCHGCSGKGWITIQDEVHQRRPYPYYPKIYPTAPRSDRFWIHANRIGGFSR